MSAASSPSDAAVRRRSAQALAGVRADAGVRLTTAVGAASSRIDELAERGGYRARFPRRADGACEAVIVNTGGGLVGGDQIHIDVRAGASTDTIVTSTAPERVYKSLGDASEVDVVLRAEAGSRLAWVPQPTLFYSGAILRRRFEADVAPDARLLLAESLVFGRPASGEVMGQSLLHDVWRVRRGGRLLWADAQRLDGDIAELLARPALGGGARAVGFALLVSDGAEDMLDAVRETLSNARSLAAASALPGAIVVRLVASVPEGLRADMLRVLERLEGRPAPRVWHG